MLLDEVIVVESALQSKGPAGDCCCDLAPYKEIKLN